MKKLIALTGTAAVLLATSLPAFSLGQIPKAPTPAGGGSGGHQGGGSRPTVSAPEIDVTAGAKGLAVLIAGMLLAGERLRRR